MRLTGIIFTIPALFLLAACSAGGEASPAATVTVTETETPASSEEDKSSNEPSAPQDRFQRLAQQYLDELDASSLLAACQTREDDGLLFASISLALGMKSRGSTTLSDDDTEKLREAMADALPPMCD